MNTQTAQIAQLETAIEILKSGDSWEYLTRDVSPRWVHAHDRDIIATIGQGHEIRRIPWSLGREVNGHKLGEGQEWHRLDWKREDLPAPRRPLLLGERLEKGDWHSGIASFVDGLVGKIVTANFHAFVSTSRPLPPSPDPYAELKKAHAEGKVIQFQNGNGRWDGPVSGNWLFPPERYRIKPTPPLVALEAGDVPAGSCIRCFSWPEPEWQAVLAVHIGGIVWPGGGKTWSDLLLEGFYFKLPGSTSWQPCSKRGKEAAL